MQKGRLTVVSVEFVEEEVDVFDIEVDQDHSFLVHGAVLHNCPRCGALDSRRWNLDGEPIEGNDVSFPGPTLHWGCFIGETEVESPNILRGFERPYSGNMVIIRTSAGNKITCTPNHPILTSTGWISAANIKKGSKVIQSLQADRIAGSAPNAVEVKTGIKDVVTSLLGSRGMVPVSVPLSTKDFHGDITDNKVATVWTNSILPDERYPSAEEHICENCLKITGTSGAPGLSGFGSNTQGPHGWLLPFVDLSDSIRMGLSFFFGHLFPSIEHGFASISDTESSIFESPDNDCSGDPEELRHCLDALASVVGIDDGFNRDDGFVDPNLNTGTDEMVPERLLVPSALIGKMVQRFSSLIALDEVIEVMDRPGFVGHVYNLETEGNWYVASNILTHNCRCTQLPITKSWEELTGIQGIEDVPPGERASMGGPVSGNTTFESWLKDQDETTRLDVLGTERLKLWESGKLTLRDFMDQSGNALTLEQLRTM